MPCMSPLTEWPKKQIGEIVEIQADASLTHRLLDLGLFAGVLVEVVSQMPFKGPLIVRAQGATLAMRRKEAECIKVRACKI